MDFFEFLSVPENQHWVFWTLVIGFGILGIGRGLITIGAKE